MVSQATINPITALLTVLLVGMSFVVPRRRLLLPVLLAACFIPADQRFMLADLDFPIVRVMVIAVALRLWLFNELMPVKWNAFDKLFLAWMVVGTVAYIAHWGTTGAVIFKSGQWVEIGGLYWVFRQTIRSWADVRYASVVLAACAIAITPFVFYELAAGRNLFHVLGRVSTGMRDGEYRCQASFPHSIIMGLFWAVSMPMFVGFLKQRSHTILFGLATAASIFMIMATSSSTPIMTLIVVGALVLAYKWRHQTRMATWGLVAGLVALHVVMTAPVWHLISRVSVVSGSTGYHRYILIDRAIQHFTEWMLIGCRTTAHWGYGMTDVTNQYVVEGVHGGLATLILFLAMLYKSARIFLHKALQARDPKQPFLYWCLFVTVLAHAISFFGVSYFGQITFLWYLILASAAYFNEVPVLAGLHARRLVRYSSVPC